MRYTVIEAFNTPLRRFRPGMEVLEAEIDGPVPPERWKEMGRLKEAPDPKSDYGSDQIAMRAAWIERGRDPAPLDKGDPILIADASMYGTLVSGIEDGPLDVHVFGEDDARRYPLVGLDRDARSVSGGYATEHLSRRAATALVRASTERVREAAEPTPEAISEGEH